MPGIQRLLDLENSIGGKTMLKRIASIGAAVILAATAFGSTADARVGGFHYGGARVGGIHHGARVIGRGYAGHYGAYHGRYFRGGYSRYGHFDRGGYRRYGYYGYRHRGYRRYGYYGYRYRGYRPYWAAGVAAGALISAEPYYFDGRYGRAYYEEPSYYQPQEYYYSPQCPYYGSNRLWWCH